MLLLVAFAGKTLIGEASAPFPIPVGTSNKKLVCFAMTIAPQGPIDGDSTAIPIVLRVLGMMGSFVEMLSMDEDGGMPGILLTALTMMGPGLDAKLMRGTATVSSTWRCFTRNANQDIAILDAASAALKCQIVQVLVSTLALICLALKRSSLAVHPWVAVTTTKRDMLGSAIQPASRGIPEWVQSVGGSLLQVGSNVVWGRLPMNTPALQLRLIKYLQLEVWR